MLRATGFQVAQGLLGVLQMALAKIDIFPMGIDDFRFLFFLLVILFGSTALFALRHAH